MKLNNKNKAPSQTTIVKENFAVTERMKSLMNLYRKFSNTPLEEKITEENLNSVALDRVAENFACNREVLKERLLQADNNMKVDTETTTLNDVEDEEEVDEVVEALDIALKAARNSYSRRINVRLIGRAGFGKSEIVDQWCDKNGLNLVEIDLSMIGPEYFGGVTARDPKDPEGSMNLPPKRLIDRLSVPNTVIFFDEYNRAKDSVRAPLHNLLTKYSLPDDRQPGGYIDLRKSVLFCVAASNPTGAAYRGAKPFESSENTRFMDPKVSINPLAHLKYLTSIYNDVINNKNASEEQVKEAKGKLALADKILRDPDFTYTSETEEEDNIEEIQKGYYKPLNYRSFHQALEASDGTKDSFIKRWPMSVTKDKLGMIKNILTDYVDADDEANQALKGGTKSRMFGKADDNISRLQGAYPGIFDDED